MAMMRINVCYLQPADSETFFKHFEEVHVPLVKEIPGLGSFEWTKIIGTGPDGPPKYALVTQLTFGSTQLAGAGMNSPQGQAATTDMNEFAPDGTEIFVGEMQVAELTASGAGESTSRWKSQ